MIGRTLSNRYKIVAELGSGGMAWVYLAEDQLEGRRVAIKVLYPQHSQDPGFLQRFRREAELSMALSHSAPQRNVVCVLDYGSDRDTHYLVMEYVPGRDLAQVLEEEGALEWQRALYLARQVAFALDHAHRHEIVHRDIKPSNIMVLPDATVRVLDFGIARARTSPDLTLSGFVGSPNYAAPEQATRQPIDVRADIYSLGVVLYRTLSGDLPFEGDTPWAIVNQHIASPPPRLDQVCPDLPASVVRLVARMLAKRPEGRFQTPLELIAAIDAVLAGEELAEAIVAPSPPDTPASLYARARDAMLEERWHEAIDAFSRLLKIDPEYGDVSEQLGVVGREIQVATLYRHARRAVEAGHWQQALGEIAKIEALAPGYRDVSALRTQAEQRQAAPAFMPGSPAEFPTLAGLEQDLEAPAAMEVPAAAQSRRAAPKRPLPGDGIAPVAPRRPRRTWTWAFAAVVVLLMIGAAWAALGGTLPLALIGRAAATAAPTSFAASGAVSAQPQPAVPTATRAPTQTASQQASHTPVHTLPALATISQPSRTPTPTPPQPTADPLPQWPELQGRIAFPRFDPARRTYDVYACTLAGGQCALVASEASQPDFLPGGERLVVHSWDPEGKGLFVIDVNGQRLWRITADIEAARPSVDFQGETFVYHSRHEPDREPRIYRSFGADVRPVEQEGDVVRGRAPAWTPDGQILYTGCLGNACGILVMRAGGTMPHQLVAGTSEVNVEASPDGRYLAFMSTRDGNWEVYVAARDGSNLRRVTDHPANDGLPTWSPDGSWLAFVSDRDGTWGVWASPLDGTAPRRLFPVGGRLEGPVAGAARHELHGWVEERITWTE